jgi:hypothetical protein
MLSADIKSAPIIQWKLHFPCAGFAIYPFVDVPPMNDCGQSFPVSTFDGIVTILVRLNEV